MKKSMQNNNGGKKNKFCIIISLVLLAILCIILFGYFICLNKHNNFKLYFSDADYIKMKHILNYSKKIKLINFDETYDFGYGFFYIDNILIKIKTELINSNYKNHRNYYVLSPKIGAYFDFFSGVDPVNGKTTRFIEIVYLIEDNKKVSFIISKSTTDIYNKEKIKNITEHLNRIILDFCS